MAVKAATELYKFVNRFARKLAAKPSGEGIMQISNKQAAIDAANDILTKFKKYKVPNEAIQSENDVKVIYNQIIGMEDQRLRRNVISPGDPRYQEITERIFGKKPGDVVDLTGKKIDTSRPIQGGKNVELTHNEKIDWLVKNVSPTAKQTIPPKPALEAMLKDGREDLIDHFFEMHTKNLGKPKVNIDTSGLKHPDLVKKMMTDEKLKPTLVKTEAQIKTKLEGMNKKTVDRIRRRRFEAAQKAEREKMAKDPEYIPEILDPEDFASGGIAGMLGETDRVPYKDGKNGFSGTFDEWRKQNPSREELLSQDPSKNIGDYIKPIPQFDERGNLIPIFSKTGKQQIEGLPEGITSDKEVFNLIIGLDIPITEKIKILGDIGFSKFRDKVEKGDKELGLYDQPGNVDKNIGIGYDDNGLSGSFMYNPDTGGYNVGFTKQVDFNKWLMGKADGGIAGIMNKFS